MSYNDELRSDEELEVEKNEFDIPEGMEDFDPIMTDEDEAL